MDKKFQILNRSSSIEKPLTSFEMLCLLNDCDERRQPVDEALNIKSSLNFENSEGLTDLDVLLTKNDLFFKLKQINMSSCELTKTPSIIFTLKYLTELNLSNNLLESLPKELGNLHNLLTLNLSGNKLSRLPKSLKYIQQLNYLDLSCNRFSEIPDVLYYGLRVLKILNLSCNVLTQFNDPPACLNKLIVLRLSNNILNQLPLWFFNNLCQLQILDISENQLGLGVEMVNYYQSGIFESLQLLNVENCNYSCENIGVFSHFRHLKVICCGNKKNSMQFGKNYFGNLKMEVFKNFKEIKELYIQNVEISSVPADFNCFKNIEVLDLSNNNLLWLSDNLCNLTTLKILNLTSNQLLYLPNDIGKLVNLQEIHLSNNKLHQIPESFYDIRSLQFIDLYNNQIEKINVSIYKNKNLKGLDLGLNFLQFDSNEYDIDIDDIAVLYNCLKDCFRRQFHCTDIRSDLQKKYSDDEKNTDSNPSSRGSTNSFGSKGTSDADDLLLSVAQQNYIDDENWEKEISFANEKDELFDPNKLGIFQPLRKSWSANFRNNYCPAEYHVPSMMETYVKNCKLASQCEPVEGQFDSD